jgi:tetratricopeptide (TPR) repeat protein
MIKRFFVALSLGIAVLPSLYCTNLDECFNLNGYFNKTPEEIHSKIATYEARLASNPGDYYSHLAMAVLYTALSSPMENPEPGASDKVVEYSKNFEKEEKNNPIAMAYYGLGCSLVSRDSKNPMTKMMMVNKAISIFDKAVSLSVNQPKEWFVRYMRANFYINLPGSFKKQNVAESDFYYIQRFYSGQSEIEGYMCNAYYNLGEIEKSRGNIDLAVQNWRKSVEINGKLRLNSKEAGKAAERLTLFSE